VRVFHKKKRAGGSAGAQIALSACCGKLFFLSLPLHLRKVQIIKRELKAAAGKKRCVSRSHHCHYTIMALCGALFRRF
jgi:hypothetical protein